VGGNWSIICRKPTCLTCLQNIGAALPLSTYSSMQIKEALEPICIINSNLSSSKNTDGYSGPLMRRTLILKLSKQFWFASERRKRHKMKVYKL